jgi:hypothetical protein
VTISALSSNFSDARLKTSPNRFVCVYERPVFPSGHRKPEHQQLPPVKMVLTGPLTPPESESDEPQNGKNDRRNPQEVNRESGTEQDQD